MDGLTQLLPQALLSLASRAGMHGDACIAGGAITISGSSSSSSMLELRQLQRPGELTEVGVEVSCRHTAVQVMGPDNRFSLTVINVTKQYYATPAWLAMQGVSAAAHLQIPGTGSVEDQPQQASRLPLEVCLSACSLQHQTP